MGATIDVWLILPPEPVKAAAAGLQRAFAHLDWIEPTPSHFLHVTLGHAEDGEPEEVVLCRVPAANSIILGPWTVIGRSALRR